MPEAIAITENISAGKPGSIILKDSLSLAEINYKAAEGGDFAGIPTGIGPLDDLMGGLQTGLHIVAAQPGAGKTALALNIARHCSREGYPVVYASFDETPERLLIKIIAAQMNLNAGAIFRGAVDPAKLEEAAKLYGHDKLNNISFMNTINLTAADFRAQFLDQLAESAKDKGLIVVDYLQPWASFISSTQGIDFRQAVGQAAIQLRSLANSLNIPIIVISAQNRTGQNSQNMTSLRESSDLEYSADSIMLISTNDKKVVGGGYYARDLYVAKNRFGESDARLELALNGKSQQMIAG